METDRNGHGPCGGSAGRGARVRLRPLLFVVLLSILVRGFFLFPVLKSDTPPKFDERAYFRRAVAFNSIVKDLAHLRSPQERDRAFFYARGIQPPFHPIWLALGMLLFGKTVAVARLMTLLLSALTTGLVFLVSSRIAGARSGLPASLLHVFYPSFLAFSHFLWSETAYIFLSFVAVHLALIIPDIPLSRKRTGLAIALGVTLGCLAMTRAAALITLFIVPAWIVFKSKTIRAKVVGFIVITASLLLTLLPWEHTLCRREGRFTLLSSFTYRNLYFGHNPLQESETDKPGRDRRDANPLRQLNEYAVSKSLPVERAARELVFREMASHPGATVLNGFKKFLYLWTYDFFTFRHVVNAAYPPTSNSGALFFLGILIVGALAFYLLVLKGLLVRGGRPAIPWLLPALVLGGTLPYVLAFGNTRFNLPQMALLLPLAGVGWAHFGDRSRAYPLVSILAVLSFGGLFYRSYTDHIHGHLRPSSHYGGVIGSLDLLHGTESLFGDVFTVQARDHGSADTLTVTIANKDGSDYSFSPDATVRVHTLSFGPNKEGIAFTVYARHPDAPLEISIRSRGPDREVRIMPVAPEYWNEFSETGLQGFRICWNGGP